jgi:hypothetical protein
MTSSVFAPLFSLLPCCCFGAFFSRDCVQRALGAFFHHPFFLFLFYWQRPVALLAPYLHDTHTEEARLSVSERVEGGGVVVPPQKKKKNNRVEKNKLPKTVLVPPPTQRTHNNKRYIRIAAFAPRQIPPSLHTYIH